MPSGPVPHDLLRIDSPHVLMSADGNDRPQWVEDEVLSTPWVVVRRSAASYDTVPVGVRGSSRSRRWAAVVEVGEIRELRTPNSTLATLRNGWVRDLPALSALAAIEPCAEHFWPSVWGPGGSVGFELATGRDTVTDTSDLDLVVNAEQPLDRDVVGQQLAEIRDRAGAVRIDLRVETPHGSFAVDEWLADRPDGLAVRTCTGPRLTLDPWHAR